MIEVERLTKTHQAASDEAVTAGSGMGSTDAVRDAGAGRDADAGERAIRPSP